MRVVEIVARHVRIPLKRVIRHASHARASTDNVVVTCRLDGGALGYGEGVPRDYVTGETVDGALALLQATDWAGFAREPVSDFAAAVRRAEELPLARPADDPRGCVGNAARCAAELAFLDACGRAFGQPLGAAVKLAAPALFRAMPDVRYSGAITSAEGLKARLAGWVMRLYGFRQLKVKVGIPGQSDVERLATIRSAVGPAMLLRIDANEAWAAADAVRKARELLPFAPAWVEQPVAHEEVAALGKLRPELGLPVMLDESLCSMADAQAALRDGTCDLFNLRLSKCGGLLPTLRLAEFASAHGLGCQLGCQVGETAILSAAGRHFAANVRDLRACEGSYDRRLVKERLSRQDITFGYGGRAPALRGSGLGIDIDPAAVERVTIRREVLLG